jgi:hypothetical protein
MNLQSNHSADGFSAGRSNDPVSAPDGFFQDPRCQHLTAARDFGTGPAPVPGMVYPEHEQLAQHELRC